MNADMSLLALLTICLLMSIVLGIFRESLIKIQREHIKNLEDTNNLLRAHADRLILLIKMATDPNLPDENEDAVSSMLNELGIKTEDENED